jgi:hypothetical protein
MFTENQVIGSQDKILETDEAHKNFLQNLLNFCCFLNRLNSDNFVKPGCLIYFLCMLS